LTKICFLAAFAKAALEQGMVGIKGHRSVGGLRASIYNACPLDSIAALVDFMAEFQRKYG
jgi:phosphoserine aminotransferase